MFYGRRFECARAIAIGACLLLGIGASGPAEAQTQQEIDWCINDGGVFSPDLAIGGCTAAIQLGRWSDKDLAWAFNSRGLAHARKHDYDLAFADYDEAIRIDPENAKVINNRGNAYRDKGDYNRAIADYNRAIELDRRHAPAYYGRWLAYRAMGLSDSATYDIQEALSIDRSLPAEYTCLGKRKEASRFLNRPLFSQWDRPAGKFGDQCPAASMTAAMIGDINKGDAAKFAEFLRENPLTHHLVLFSNGGNVAEAIEIGRMVRSRFMTTTVGSGCLTGPCCMSACVLVAFAGVNNSLNDIGVHRPRSDEMGGRDVSVAQTVYKDGEKRIRAYLAEMEAPPGLADLMMTTDSSKIRIMRRGELPGVVVDERLFRPINRYRPPSIHEWLLAKCKSRHPEIFASSEGSGPDQERIELCLAGEEDREFLRRHLR